MQINKMYRMINILFSEFYATISFSSAIDSPEVLCNTRYDSSSSLATLVYIDNDWLNVYDRLQERLALVWKYGFDYS